MNCFSIRELQSVFKRRFFTDLTTSNDYRYLLEKSMIGLKYKLNNNMNISHNMFIFNNYGTSKIINNKYNLYQNIYLSNTSSSDDRVSFLFLNFFLKNLKFDSFFLFINSILPLNYFFNLISNLSFYSFFYIFNLFFYIKEVFILNIISSFSLINNLLNFNLFNFKFLNKNNKIEFYSNYSYFYSENNLFLMSEIKNTDRFTRFSNPTITYNYKYGNYSGI